MNGANTAGLEQAALQIGKLLVAFVLAFPMAWDRERSVRSLGLRTFPLVAVSSCAFVLVGQALFGRNPAASSRLLQGVMAGVGFLGAGAIVKHGLEVHGTATAAAVWATAALGVAVAYWQVAVALAISAIGFGTLHWLRLFKSEPEGGREPDGGGDGEAGGPGG